MFFTGTSANQSTAWWEELVLFPGIRTAVEEDGCLSKDRTAGGSDCVFHEESYRARQSIPIRAILNIISSAIIIDGSMHYGL